MQIAMEAQPLMAKAFIQVESFHTVKPLDETLLSILRGAISLCFRRALICRWTSQCDSALGYQKLPRYIKSC